MSPNARYADEDGLAELNAKQETGTAPITPQYYLAELAKPEEIQVLVSQRDFEAALAELVPSVSQAEMDHYKVVQVSEASSHTSIGDEADLSNSKNSTRLNRARMAGIRSQLQARGKVRVKPGWIRGASFWLC